MATAYVRAVGKAAGAPSDFGGPMAKQHRMAVVTALAAWNAVVPYKLTAPVLGLVIVLAAVTALRRLWHVAAALRA